MTQPWEKGAKRVRKTSNFRRLPLPCATATSSSDHEIHYDGVRGGGTRIRIRTRRGSRGRRCSVSPRWPVAGEHGGTGQGPGHGPVPIPMHRRKAEVRDVSRQTGSGSLGDGLRQPVFVEWGLVCLSVYSGWPATAGHVGPDFFFCLFSITLRETGRRPSGA